MSEMRKIAEGLLPPGFLEWAQERARSGDAVARRALKSGSLNDVRKLVDAWLTASGR